MKPDKIPTPEGHWDTAWGLTPSTSSWAVPCSSAAPSVLGETAVWGWTFDGFSVSSLFHVQRMPVLVLCSAPGNIPKSIQPLGTVWDDQRSPGCSQPGAGLPDEPVSYRTGTSWGFPLPPAKGGADSQPARVTHLQNRVKRSAWRMNIESILKVKDGDLSAGWG